MALKIQSREIESLVDEVAELSGETKDDAIRTALLERRVRLVSESKARAKAQTFLRYLGQEVWPRVPEEELRRPFTKTDEEELLGMSLDEI